MTRKVTHSLKSPTLQENVQHCRRKSVCRSELLGKSPGKVPKGSAVNSPLKESLEELGLSSELLSPLNNLGISKPMEVESPEFQPSLMASSLFCLAHWFWEDSCIHACSRSGIPFCKIRSPSRFRAAMIGGEVRMKRQEDVLNSAVDMVVGTLLMHVKEGHMTYGGINFFCDVGEISGFADTMFDRGFGPEAGKFLGPLRNRSSHPGRLAFQTVLATISKVLQAVQKLLDGGVPVSYISTQALSSSKVKVATMKQQEVATRQRQSSKEAASRGNIRGPKTKTFGNPSSGGPFQALRGTRGKTRFEA
ncbi:hypothetical protein R1sor_006981 [Riccia sorocarpa]|uniref:Uncharacterized protein n=1 Tax=Riccia sorocarpa TaxID=122646 RepID=A0ABD3HP45_9MARC